MNQQLDAQDNPNYVAQKHVGNSVGKGKPIEGEDLDSDDPDVMVWVEHFQCSGQECAENLKVTKEKQ